MTHCEAARKHQAQPDPLTVELALEVSTHPDHMFDLAIQLDDLDTALTPRPELAPTSARSHSGAPSATAPLRAGRSESPRNASSWPTTSWCFCSSTPRPATVLASKRSARPQVPEISQVLNPSLAAVGGMTKTAFACALQLGISSTAGTCSSRRNSCLKPRSSVARLRPRRRPKRWRPGARRSRRRQCPSGAARPSSLTSLLSREPHERPGDDKKADLRGWLTLHTKHTPRPFTEYDTIVSRCEMACVVLGADPRVLAREFEHTRTPGNLCEGSTFAKNNPSLILLFQPIALIL